MGAFNKKLRKTYFNFFNNQLNIFRRLHYQSIMIIHPVDFPQDGIENMCNGCPAMTLLNGEHVCSCVIEEQLKYGEKCKYLPSNNYELKIFLP